MVENKAENGYPWQIWTDLLLRTLGLPRVEDESQAGGMPSDAKDDPWVGLIDRLWQANPFSTLLPLDPAETALAFRQVWAGAVRNPVYAWTNYAEFLERYGKLASLTVRRLLGAPEQQYTPLAAPEKGDKRFSAPDWQQNAVFDFVKQAYLLAATSTLRAAAELEGLDERQRRKVKFYLRQFLDAISPTNLALTNPEVIHEAIATGGQSLVKGLENLLRDLADGQIKMTDDRYFAPGRNLAVTPGQVIYRNQLIELIQYTPQTETVHALPLVFVPHWINKYYILDMQPENSLIRFLVEQGFTVFIISWKNPDASMEATTFDDYMELGPLTAFRIAKEVTGAPRVNAVGYCIGGTLLAMTLSYLAAIGDDSVNAASFFVTLLDFSDVGDTEIFVEPQNVAYVEELMRQRGYLDSREMATMFNMLRANDLIWSFVVNNYLMGKEPPAFDLLYWNADGTRMARAAHSFYLRNTYVENNLVKPGKVVMKRVPIDLRRIRQDIYAVGTELDHLVPWRTAWRISQLTNSNVRFVVGGSGHIAGVINPPSKGRGYWLNDKPAADAEEWFQGAKHYTGSWWADWVAWLRARSGDQVAPPAMGGGLYHPLAPAPGTYVLEK